MKGQEGGKWAPERARSVQGARPDSLTTGREDKQEEGYVQWSHPLEEVAQSLRYNVT